MTDYLMESKVKDQSASLANMYMHTNIAGLKQPHAIANTQVKYFIPVAEIQNLHGIIN